MTAMAEFTLLPRTVLPELAGIADEASLQKVLEKGRSVAGFNWPGWVFFPLQAYLAREIGMDREKFELAGLSKELAQRGGLAGAIFGVREKNEFLAKLDPQTFAPEALAEFANQFNKATVPDAGEAMVAGIRALRTALSHVDESNVLVLSIEQGV
jgi:hypothetical protein